MDVVWIFESLRFCEIKMRFNTEHNFCVTLASQRSRAAIVKREGGGQGIPVEAIQVRKVFRFARLRTGTDETVFP